MTLSPATGVLVRRPRGDTQGEDSHVMMEVQTHSAAIVTGDEELGGALDFSTLGQ